VIASVSTVIDAPLDEVWRWLDDFANWHLWIPRILSTTMDEGLDQAPVGSTRILGREGGSTIREQLRMKDADRHTLSYVFDGPYPYPVRRYVGTVRVEPVTTSGATFVHWSGDYDSDAADETAAAETFRAIYLTFFAALTEAIATDRAAV
jgi:hypothetical protein